MMRPAPLTSDRGQKQDDPRPAGYERLRLELRALDKECADSLLLTLRVHRARKAIVKAALSRVNRNRAEMDAAIFEDHRDLDAPPRGVRLAYNAARSNYDRLYHAYGWLLSSAKQLGVSRAAMTPEQGAASRDLRDRLLADATEYLDQMADALARLRGRS